MLTLEHHQLELRYDRLRVHTHQRRARLAASVSEHGQQTPVLVTPTDKHYVLVDGYLRAEVIRTMGRDTLTAVALDMDEADALLLRHKLTRRVGASALEEAWLLAELVEHHGKTLEALAIALERSVSWVSRRMALVRALPERVVQEIRKGRISPQAAMRYLVPLARANAEHCETLVKNLSGQHVSVRELGRLYVDWRSANTEGRSRMVTQPHLYLAVDAEIDRDDDVSVGEARDKTLLRDFRSLTGFIRRVLRTLADRSRVEHASPLPRALQLAWQELLAAFASLENQIAQSAQDPHAG